MASIHSCVTPREKWQRMGFVVFFFPLFMFSVSAFSSANSTHSSPNTDADIRSDVLYRSEPGPGPHLFPKGTLNGWKRIDKWTGNTPGKRRGQAASHLQTTGADGKMAMNMVLFGGLTEGKAQNIELAGSMTWIYTPATNSWRSFLTQIPLVVGHTMVTMCDKIILLFGGAAHHEDYTFYKMSNDTRLFNGESEAWTIVEVERTDGGIKPRIYHAAASVHKPASNSSCTCKESMLVFGGSRHVHVRNLLESDEEHSYDDLWELRCVENGYRWFHLNSASDENGKPSMRYMAAAASQFDVMFMYGGCTYAWPIACEPLHDLWTYSTKSEKWERLHNVKLPYVHWRLKLGYVEKPSYRMSSRVSGFLLCCRKPLYFYDILTQQWNSLDTLDSDENFEGLEDFSTAVVDGNVIVYGGVDVPYMILQDGLWTITMLARDACLLHKKPQNLLSPPVRGMQVAVVDRVANMVIIHGGLTPKTMFYNPVESERNTGIWLLDMHSLTWSVRYPSTQLSRVGHVGALLSYPDSSCNIWWLYSQRGWRITGGLDMGILSAFKHLD